MALSIREQALAAFFALFSGLTSYPTKKRMPNWVIDVSEMPALIQIDGRVTPLSGDDATSGISGVVRIGIEATVVAAIRVASTDELGPALSVAESDILAAVGADPTLGGLAENVLWDGTEDPVPLLEQGAPPHAVLSINFVIVTTRAELDPLSHQ